MRGKVDAGSALPRSRPVLRPARSLQGRLRGLWPGAAVVCLVCLSAAAGAAGCVTRSRADARAREAFRAGQREAQLRMALQPQAASVTVLGDVKNHTIAWTDDLTLAKAIVAAGYGERSDPTDIVIIRNGKGTQVDPQKLLRGEDVPLQAGDVVAIRR